MEKRVPSKSFVGLTSANGTGLIQFPGDSQKLLFAATLPTRTKRDRKSKKWKEAPFNLPPVYWRFGKLFKCTHLPTFMKKKGRLESLTKSHGEQFLGRKRTECYGPSDVCRAGFQRWYGETCASPISSLFEEWRLGVFILCLFHIVYQLWGGQVPYLLNSCLNVS